ncbi:DNA mismatch repair endonuclease MutL [Arsukibacterium sp.]|uniref:DNA mismatch repair endonuclease MutL n=1 Tax=Arsukibacterium sp. TaxID=1977258 RepID=UPI002FD9453B
MMPIQLLPPQLANQIAAGEVVERPASVVKELVENSLDAGASQIDIIIDKGGSKRILVRDNGSGIAEQELVLALSRHATSKITDLADLENICSLGFRGEALASISAVSRLTLTSRTEAQTAAWQAQAEGRDMAVQVRPAAHPVGTSIEVLDLFFNTPARRRFLRTDKTEFSHIDELVKRLALSRFDVSWHLSHNEQQIRQLPIASTPEQKLKRISQLCGRAFASDAVYIDNEYGELRLTGWLLAPEACGAQAACQFSYVNGRMMRDKLLNHAIRQAYGDQLAPDCQPAFVLYLSCEPRQVDVNVHPAKHEVRFHQARLVHDFVVHALSDALAQLAPGTAAVKRHTESDNNVTEQPCSYAGNSGKGYSGQSASGYAVKSANGYATKSPSGYAGSGARQAGPAAVEPQLVYLGQLQQGAVALTASARNTVAANSPSSANSSQAAYLLSENQFLVVSSAGKLWLLSLAALLAPCWLTDDTAVPLLLPLRISLTATEAEALTQQADLCARLGFDFLLQDAMLIVRAMPPWLRATALNQWLPLLPAWLSARQSGASTEQQTALYSTKQLLSMLLSGHYLAAEQLINYFKLSLNSLLCEPLAADIQAIELDISQSIERLRQHTA